MSFSKLWDLFRYLSTFRSDQRSFGAVDHNALRVSLESLEDRVLLRSDLLVSSLDIFSPGNHVLRYDGDTGAYRGVFIKSLSGGLYGSYSGMEIGGDGELYVCKSLEDFAESGQVQRHRVRNGAYLDTFVAKGSGGLRRPAAMHFGPDGNLYVLKWSGAGTADDRVFRYDGTTGSFIDEFITFNYGIRYTDMVFGPDGNLYITESTGNVQRFDGRTGRHRGLFAGGAGGDFESLVFGPDRNLYVSEDHYIMLGEAVSRNNRNLPGRLRACGKWGTEWPSRPGTVQASRLLGI